MGNKTFLLLVALLLLASAYAQVRTNFNNKERLNERGRYNKTYLAKAVFEIAPPDLTQALRRDRAEDSLSSKILNIAQPVEVNINVVELASWTQDATTAFGKFTLRAKGAKTLSINFSDFSLPAGAEMYIYNKEAEMITGPITAAENNAGKRWGSSIYKGDELTIEVKVPTSEKSNLSLRITNVAYGYKDMFVDKIAGFGQSGACNINLLCPQGAAWAAERNSVAWITSSDGGRLCSSAMLMNTCSTNIPYVLTANHCFQANQDVGGWRFQFQAWSATCTPSQNSDGILFNGSTLRANWNASDFCLVEMNQTPPANSGIHYAGWSRQTNAATNGVGIHHPQGDVMKISTYTTPLVREDNPARCNVNPVGWLQWVVQWNEGVTEGGSSGSPLFDQDHRVVGQLSGGPSSCSQAANCRLDMYGRFDNSWTGGGTNTTRLSNWLDPSNSGAMTTNTTNISNLISIRPADYGISGPTQFCVYSNYSISNLPQGATVQWQATPQGVVNINSPDSPQTTLTRITDGAITLTATVTSCGNAHPIILTQQLTIGNILSGSISNAGKTLPMNTVNSVSAGSSFVSFQWPGVTNITCVQSSNNPSVSQTGFIYYPSSKSFWFSLSSGQSISVRFSGNGCSSTVLANRIFTVGGYYAIAATPNPANANINVKISQIADANEKATNSLKISNTTGVTKFYLYNFNTGALVKQWSYPEIKILNYRLNLDGVKNGYYLLQMERDNKIATTKILVINKII
jgi:hypothetical protein